MYIYLYSHLMYACIYIYEYIYRCIYAYMSLAHWG